MAILSSLGLLCEEQLNPRCVGCHPLDRDRNGGSGLESPELLGQIAFIGFSPSAMAHALMEEAAFWDSSFQLFNQRLVEGNASMVPFGDGEVRFGCIACGHVYHGFRALGARPGLAWGDPLVTMGGCLSIDRLRSSYLRMRTRACTASSARP